MFNFVKRRKWYFTISGIILLAGIISLSVTGLNPGIDFVSGSTMTIDFEEEVSQEQLRDKLGVIGHGDAVIQVTGDLDYYIRTRELEPAQDGRPSEQDQIKKELKATFGKLTIEETTSVSSVISSQTVRNAGFAVLAAIVGILLYITWAFRKLPKPFHYGVCAVIALFHDMLIMIGIFSILGWVANVEVNSMFIIAALTILGYSVNDTIVVFDRIRENLLKGISKNFATTVNVSINESLGRSVATSVTTLLVLLALYLFGGATISTFVLALIIGVISGTYSSICIASQVLVAWEQGTFGRTYRKVKGLFGKGEPVTIGGEDQQA
jgi:preprotein translocase subunit SecF